MQEVQELVPHYKELEDLYHKEEFQVLDKFLCSVLTQLQAELLSLDYGKDEIRVKAASLAAQINLIGTIRNLPQMVKSIKTQFDEVEAYRTKQREAAQDILQKEGF